VNKRAIIMADTGWKKPSDTLLWVERQGKGFAEGLEKNYEWLGMYERGGLITRDEKTKTGYRLTESGVLLLDEFRS
jgi:DNA-binding PadR family transcriptional regulator